jgi:hypothetical protein
MPAASHRSGGIVSAYAVDRRNRVTGTDTFMVQRMATEQGPYALPDLQAQVRIGDLRSDTMVRRSGGVDNAWFRAVEIPGLFSDKDWLTTLLISFFVGVFGIDRFYLGYTGLGILKLVTFGGCGVWALIDLILILMNKVDDAKGRPLRK